MFEREQGAGSEEERSRDFDRFLQLTEKDTSLLREHASVLRDRSDDFAREFYRYLEGFPETSAVLDRYRTVSGSVEALVSKQMEHFEELLWGDLGPASYRRLLELGAIHYESGVQPVWILGSYLMFLRRLRERALRAPGLDEAGRETLLHSVEKIVFRDAGLMTEGYWLSAQAELTRKGAQIDALRKRMHALLSNIPLVLWSVAVPDGELLFVSPHGEGQLPDVCSLPLPHGDRILPQHRPSVQSAWSRALGGDEVWVDAEVLDVHGPCRWVRYTLCPHPTGSREPVRIDGIMEDLTEVKALSVRLLASETTDRLTGLPNRTLILDRLEQAIQIGERRRHREVVEVALIILDLDQFGHVNKDFGYRVGDELLAEVAGRLSTVLRSSDSLARVGGDEFAILLPDAAEGVAEAERVVENVMGCFQRTFRCGGQEIYLRPAIGVAVWPAAGDTAAELFSRAEVALSASEDNAWKPQFYKAGQSRQKGRVLEVTAELHHALERDQMVLHFQPIIEIATARLVGVEALIRWQHPRRGLLLPGEFLGIAERSGAIRALTEWTIGVALRQCAEWRERGLHDLRVSCNVSPRSLQDERIVDRIRLSLRETETVRDILELEITEESLISGPDRVRSILQDFTALGAVIAIDDFGTGYSSLSYLRTLPVSTLKIDRSIVKDITSDAAAMAIVASTVDLAHTLGHSVVAEGVESEEVMEKLYDLGCERAQGYYIGTPMTPADLIEWAETSPYSTRRPELGRLQPVAPTGGGSGSASARARRTPRADDPDSTASA